MHKQAEINSCLPNCWAYSPTTFCLVSTINCLAVPGMVGEQTQVSQYIGNFPFYEAKKTAQNTGTLNRYSARGQCQKNMGTSKRTLLLQVRWYFILP